MRRIDTVTCWKVCAGQAGDGREDRSVALTRSETVAPCLDRRPRVHDPYPASGKVAAVARCNGQAVGARRRDNHGVRSRNRPSDCFSPGPNSSIQAGGDTVKRENARCKAGEEDHGAAGKLIPPASGRHPCKSVADFRSHTEEVNSVACGWRRRNASTVGSGWFRAFASCAWRMGGAICGLCSATMAASTCDIACHGCGKRIAITYWKVYARRAGRGGVNIGLLRLRKVER